MKSKVSIVKCASYKYQQVETALRSAVSLLGGITNFIKPGSKVLVKPNLVMAKEPQYAIDTHPEVVRAIVRLLKEINARIYIGDGPSIWGAHSQQVQLVYEASGMKKLAQEEGVNLVEFDKRRWHGEFPLTTWVDECEYIISVPKFKTHNYTVLTGAIKNLFGLIPGTYKLELHKEYFTREKFAQILVDIYELIRPSLTVIDGILAIEGEGPGTSGNIKNLGLILAGSDGVALDSIMALIMGLRPFNVPTIKEAYDRKIGNARLEDIEILGETLKNTLRNSFKLPRTTLLPKRMPVILQNFVKFVLESIIRFYPIFDQQKCVLCQACIKSCPNNAVKVDNDRLVIDYSKCLSCFCCQESCPHRAINVKKSLLAKLMRLQ